MAGKAQKVAVATDIDNPCSNPVKQMILFFDTETTGVPRNYKAPAQDLDNWPRVIQLAWCLFDNEGLLVDSACDLISPDGWTVPDEKFWIENGFSTTKSLASGIPIADALGKFVANMERSELMVAHNMDFDFPIISAELIRAGITPVINPRRFCTMKYGTNLCQIPGPWPKLEELHVFLFGSGFEGAHDALNDVKACARCFFELKARKRMTEAPIIYSNIVRYDDLPFDEYLKLDGNSHSYLKSEINGISPEFTQTHKVRLGKLVDACLCDPSTVDMLDELYPAARSIAFEIERMFGSLISTFKKQISYTADVEYQGFIMPVTGRLDFLLEDYAVIDLKVTHEKDVHTLIRHMGYDNQVWHYARLAGVTRRFILIYSVPLRSTFLVKLDDAADHNKFWAEKAMKFGKVAA